MNKHFDLFSLNPARCGLARLVIVSFLISISIPCWAQSDYFTGDGRKDMSLAILVPESQGLSKDLAYLPAMVQGCLVSNISKYSRIAVLDRVALDKVIAETLDPTYKDNLNIVRLGHVAQTDHIMTGKLIKTSSGYTIQINVTDTTPNAKTTASYSGACTVAQLDDQTAIQKASLELLTQMGVRLTDSAKKELSTASSVQVVNAQTALAQGITAQKQGTEVAALSYYFQAAAFDPSLMEAVNRSSVLAANISSGSIGDDARNDIQWRKNWVARLEETEKYFNNFFDNFFKTVPLPYTLYYVSDIKQVGNINYQNETMNLSGITTNLHASHEWALSVEPTLQSVRKSVQAVQDGLDATGRKTVWGLDKWPSQGAFNRSFFGRQVKNFTIVVELVNSRNKVIGRETFQTGGSYEIPIPLPWNETRIQISADERKTVNFSNVNANDVTDNLTVRIASVNGTPAETATRNKVLQIKSLTGDAEWNLNVNMVRVQGGTFMMGSPANEPYRNDDEDPQHQVTLSSFYMGKCEVTQKEYQEVMGINPSNFKGDNLPVENVSWHDAIEYCNKRSQREGLTPAYTRNGDNVTWNRSANGYRLPTEAEWEYACRAGTTTAYNTGANISDNTGWYSANSGNKTHPVGQKPANAWGLFDIHGNVWEWCWDWYGSYSSGAQTDPVGASSGTGRVLRGGSWSSSAEYLRSALRSVSYPYFRYGYLGFRLVRP